MKVGAVFAGLARLRRAETRPTLWRRKMLQPIGGGSPLPFIKEGFVLWSPRHANTAFERCRYERNRNEKQAQSHIQALARQMRNGEWLDKSAIDFARLPDGTLILVNGHHRLLAQVAAGVDITWSISIHDCRDKDEVANLFWRFDTVVRKRTLNNVLNAVNQAENMGLTKQMARYLASAVTFIENGMGASQQAGGRYYTPHEKIELMADWQAEALVYQDCIKPAEKKLVRKLYGAQVVAVALVTIRADREKAIEFWSGAASDDGLRRGDPRKTLVNFLRDTHAHSTGMTGTAAACARAWSAWWDGREITFIRVGRTPIQISGSKMVVKP